MAQRDTACYRKDMPADAALQTFYGTIPLILVLAGLYFREQMLLKDILDRLKEIENRMGRFEDRMGRFEEALGKIRERLVTLETRAGVIYHE